MSPASLFNCAVLKCAALLLLTACSPLQARPIVNMAVVDHDDGQHGQWLEQYKHAGDQWIAGMPGHRYSVRLTNTSSERVMVVLSVDGVNAVTGEDAAPDQSGYVLAPWQSTEVSGWRKSLDDVAQFYFTELPDSYAARTGRPDNVGVIGIAVFREAHDWMSDASVNARNDSSASTASRDEGRAEPMDAPSPAEAGSSAKSQARIGDAAPPSVTRQHIGTGHGERQWSPVGSTTFERASRLPVQTTILRYDAPQRLVALGILPRPSYRASSVGPRAFPGGFVSDPPPR